MKHDDQTHRVLFKGHRSIALVWSMLLLFIAQFATAQNRWSLEVRTGPSFATRDLGDAHLGVGFGFEGTIAHRITPQHLYGYAGWGWNQFSADRSFAGNEVQFEETGYTFGLQFIHPFGLSKLNFMLLVGGVANHIEVENKDGDLIADSGHGLGWQAGGGLAVPLGDHFLLMPSLRYRSLSKDIEVNEVKTAVDLDYIATSISLAWLF